MFHFAVFSGREISVQQAVDIERLERWVVLVNADFADAAGQSFTNFNKVY